MQQENEDSNGKTKLLCICGGYPSPTSLLDDYKLFFQNNKLNKIYSIEGINSLF